MTTGETGQRMLVVEDDAAVRRMLRLMLRAQGFDVVEADTGTKALATLAEGGVDALLLDLTLPDDRLPDILAWLHAHDEQPPWLVISAMDRAEASRIDPEIEGRFVAKPFDVWTLLGRIRAMTGANSGGTQ